MSLRDVLVLLHPLPGRRPICGAQYFHGSSITTMNWTILVSVKIYTMSYLMGFKWLCMPAGWVRNHRRVIKAPMMTMPFQYIGIYHILCEVEGKYTYIKDVGRLLCNTWRPMLSFVRNHRIETWPTSVSLIIVMNCITYPWKIVN